MKPISLIARHGENVLVAVQQHLSPGPAGSAANGPPVTAFGSRPFVALVIGATVVTLSIVFATLPWPDPFFATPPWTLPVIAAAGTGIAVLSTRAPRGAVRWSTMLFAASVLVYPLLLGAANEQGSTTGSPVVRTAAMTGHMVPITLIELLPVVATASVTGRRMRIWIAAILTASGIDVLLMAVANAVPDAPGALRVGGTVLWLGGAFIAPVATWRAVRGTTGSARHRAVLAAISSLVGILILAFCNLLGLTEQAQRLGDEASVGLLMIGFSGATATTAWGAVTAVGDSSAWILRPAVLGRTLALALIVAVMLAAAVLALTLLSGGAPALDMVLFAIVVSVGAGLAASRLYRWAIRIVDPVAELRAEYEAGDRNDPPGVRIQRALRRIVDDPGLRVQLRAPGEEAWEQARRRIGAGSTEPAPVVLARVPGSDGEPAAIAFPSSPRAARRLRTFDDGSTLLWAVVLENDVEHERRRADAAASAERDRLRRDLHDGLQGRLLGIALNLQLGGRGTDDPVTRELIQETVGALRNAADEARTIADGRLPEALQRGGLRAALADLVGGLHPFVELEIPAERFPARVEETGYFLVGEAVGNAIKHGGAGHVRVRVLPNESGTAVTLSISDDGTGGADPRAGTGLRRLGERVAGSGGILVVREADPHGTIVEASLPCGS